MTSQLSYKFVNGLTGDPAVFLTFAQSSDALLFDAGDLGALTHKELLRVKLVCITHTHFDHFFGFDRLIRVNIPHSRTLEVIGPTGITANIVAKLRGYLWNLLIPDQVNFIVHEISDNQEITSSMVSNTTNFSPVLLNSETPLRLNQTNNVVKTRLPWLELKTCLLDHGTSVLSFMVKLKDTYSIDEAALESLGLTPGPWISHLQRISRGEDQSSLVDISGKSYLATDLIAKISRHKEGERLSYVTDIVFSKSNIDKLSTAFFSTNTLICEANYLAEHREKAFAKKHLTTRQAALIAARLLANSLKIFHISGIYEGCAEQNVAESSLFFNEFQSFSPEALNSELLAEFKV
jgi:ribonuclease Z